MTPTLAPTLLEPDPRFSPDPLNSNPTRPVLPALSGITSRRPVTFDPAPTSTSTSTPTLTLFPGNFTGARTVFQLGVEAHCPDMPSVINGWAMLALKQRHYDEARELLVQGLQVQCWRDERGVSSG